MPVKLFSLNIKLVFTNEAAPLNVVEGVIENPKPNAQLSGQALITGWCYLQPLAKIEIYQDGGFIGNGKVGVYRPELRGAFGYSFLWLARLRGPHSIQVAAYNAAGDVKWLSSIYDHRLLNIPVFMT